MLHLPNDSKSSSDNNNNNNNHSNNHSHNNTNDSNKNNKDYKDNSSQSNSLYSRSSASGDCTYVSFGLTKLINVEDVSHCNFSDGTYIHYGRPWYLH